MSWSFQAIGSPDKVVEALEAHSEEISKNPTDMSRAEFDEAKPHLIALVKQNYVREGSHRHIAIRLNASGTGSTERADDGTSRKVSSNCSVQIEHLYGYVC